ncbi:MAG: hypothetical protein AB1705_10180 [Verrucomicrobiota bacterium]
MKNSLVALSLLAALVCVCLLLSERQRVERLRAQARAAGQSRESLAADAARRSESPQGQLHNVRAQTAGRDAETRRLRGQLAEAQAQAKERKGPAAMFRDPEMKEALKAQAKNMAARAAQSLIDAGLARHLQLDDTASAALKQLLADRTAIVWDQVLVPMSTGELDDDGIAAASKSVKQAIDDNAAQIRALVGDAGFAAFEWYEKTQVDRDTLKRMAPQFEKEGHPLTAEQQSQLFAVMNEERAGFQFQYDFGDPLNDIERWHENLNEERVGVYFGELVQLNERIQQRAQTVLSEEQAALLKKFTNHQLQQARFTVRSTLALMGRSR